ncbi:hypothetical protein CFB84_43105 [Burkholderia aenigmatica]|nr:hypothetical protein CFB84_43105 [Burkholderia aenigmatica]
MHNCSPRGIARRVALGRWDYSTKHILGLQFTINFLGQGFELKEAHASFLSTRRWKLTRETSQHFSQIVEISTRNDRLVATGYAMYPGGWLCQVYEKDLHVPDVDSEDARLSGDKNAWLLLDQMKEHLETGSTIRNR